MIHLLKEKAASAQVQEMLQEYDNMIKLVVDIRRCVLSGGGEMHTDCEFESLINIRPRLGNRNILIQDESLRKQVEYNKGLIGRCSMNNKEKLRERFLRDPLPRRLGGLAATLGRISSSARKSTEPTIVANLLDEAKHLIEWTAADTPPETAAELVRIQNLDYTLATRVGRS